MDENYHRNVFVNCPLDEEFEPILQAVLFCIVHLGFLPRLSVSRADGGEDRLRKIVEHIEASKYSIHDLSRTRASKADEIFRLNMPFELGIDYAFRNAMSDHRTKKFLVFEGRRFEAKAALSDLSGCDFEIHDNSYEKAIGEVRNFLVNEAGARADGKALIISRYHDFGAWYWEKQLDAGSSEADIRDYPTREVLRAMLEWVSRGEPV